MGIFDDPTAMQPGPATEPDEAPIASRPRKPTWVGRTYYRFAYTSASSSLAQRGHVEVLEKLAVGFDRYIKILLMRESTSIS